MEPVIDVDDVSKTYQIEKNSVKALRHVSLKVHKGQSVAIVGKSGAGKSTLLHIIGTLDQPTEGTVKLNNTNVCGLPDRYLSQFRNQTIGFIFQMHNLLPEFSALENVTMPGLIAGMSLREVKDRGLQLLKAVGLEQRAQHRPSELSGGEQQRVAIARALFMSPSIILADEPTGNLDDLTSRKVEDLLLQLAKEHEVTMLLVTHDRDLAARLEFQLTMENGTIVDYGGLN